MIMFDWTINIGNMMVLISFLLGGIWWLFTFRSSVEALTRRIADIEGDIQNVQKELKVITEILVTLGQYDARFTGIEQTYDARFAGIEHTITRIQKELDTIRGLCDLVRSKGGI